MWSPEAVITIYKTLLHNVAPFNIQNIFCLKNSCLGFKHLVVTLIFLIEKNEFTALCLQNTETVLEVWELNCKNIDRASKTE